MATPKAKATDKTKDFTSAAGNKFVFQRVAPSKWLDVLDQADAGGVRSRSKLYPAVLESVIVQPAGLGVDDFEQEPYNGFGELDEVVTQAIRFQQGK